MRLTGSLYPCIFLHFPEYSPLYHADPEFSVAQVPEFPSSQSFLLWLAFWVSHVWYWTWLHSAWAPPFLTRIITWGNRSFLISGTESKCTVLSLIDSRQLWPWTNTELLISVNILKLPATPCTCHRYDKIKVIHCLALPAPSSSAAPGTTILLLTAWIWLLWIPLLNRLQNLLLYVWFVLLNTVFPRLSHTAISVRTFFLSETEWRLLYVYTTFCLSLPSFMDTWLVVHVLTCCDCLCYEHDYISILIIYMIRDLVVEDTLSMCEALGSVLTTKRGKRE